MATPSNKYPADTEAMHNTIRRTTYAASNEAAHEPKRELKHGRVSERMRSSEPDPDPSAYASGDTGESGGHFWSEVLLLSLHFCATHLLLSTLKFLPARCVIQ